MQLLVIIIPSVSKSEREKKRAKNYPAPLGLFPHRVLGSHEEKEREKDAGPAESFCCGDSPAFLRCCCLTLLISLTANPPCLNHPFYSLFFFFSFPDLIFLVRVN